ncbi:hypothetical protein IJ670_05080 [bacterium]|nr:hypothetical protein [bacterium]
MSNKKACFIFSKSILGFRNFDFDILKTKKEKIKLQMLNIAILRALIAPKSESISTFKITNAKKLTQTTSQEEAQDATK